jgi:hypothetical protein
MRKMFNEMIEIQTDEDCENCGPGLAILEIHKIINSLDLRLLNNTNLKILQFLITEEDLDNKKNIILILNNTDSKLLPEISKMPSYITCAEVKELNTDEVLGYLNYKRHCIISEH